MSFKIRDGETLSFASADVAFEKAIAIKFALCDENLSFDAGNEPVHGGAQKRQRTETGPCRNVAASMDRGSDAVQAAAELQRGAGGEAEARAAGMQADGERLLALAEEDHGASTQADAPIAPPRAAIAV